MRTTIDSAGRLVIPKALRDELGLVTGEVQIFRDGAGVRIEPIAGTGTDDERGRMVIATDISLDDEAVRAMRMTDQR